MMGKDPSLCGAARGDLGHPPAAQSRSRAMNTRWRIPDQSKSLVLVLVPVLCFVMGTARTVWYGVVPRPTFG